MGPAWDRSWSGERHRFKVIYCVKDFIYITDEYIQKKENISQIKVIDSRSTHG